MSSMQESRVITCKGITVFLSFCSSSAFFSFQLFPVSNFILVVCFDENKKRFQICGLCLKRKSRLNPAVAWGPGQPLVLEEVQVDPPKAMEIRIKVVCTSLCRSDINQWESKAHEKAHVPLFPRIFGHEASGTVESVGEGVTEFIEGDHVLTLFTGECMACRHCISGKSNMCQTLGLERNGVMHSDKTTRLGAAWKVADVSKGSTVVIFGLGTVGLSVAQGAKLRGASKIIGIDTNPAKYEKGKAFGITEFINPDDCSEPIHQVIRRVTDGGADYCFECIGDTEMITTALQSCCDGWGLTVTLGVPKIIPLFSAHYALLLCGRTLKGSLFGGWRPKSEIPSLVDMYMKKEIQIDELVTHDLPFEDINKAFNLMKEGKCLRCVMHMPNCFFTPDSWASVSPRGQLESEIPGREDLVSSISMAMA
ncbi:hypothetical protein ACLOJK_014296 [Asimina triloba]